MRKVMRTEVEELGYCDENIEIISGDRKKMSLLSLYYQKRVARRFCEFVFLPNFRLIDQQTDQIFFVQCDT